MVNKIRKHHTFDEQIYKESEEIAKELSQGGVRFSISGFLNEQLKKFVEAYRHLLKK